MGAKENSSSCFMTEILIGAVVGTSTKKQCAAHTDEPVVELFCRRAAIFTRNFKSHHAGKVFSISRDEYRIEVQANARDK